MRGDLVHANPGSHLMSEKWLAPLRHRQFGPVRSTARQGIPSCVFQRRTRGSMLL